MWVWHDSKHVSRYVSLTRRFRSVSSFCSHSRQTPIHHVEIYCCQPIVITVCAQITHSCEAINLSDGGSASTFCKERKMTRREKKKKELNYLSNEMRVTSGRNLWANCVRRFTYKWIRRLESNWVELCWAELSWMNRRETRDWENCVKVVVKLCEIWVLNVSNGR